MSVYNGRRAPNVSQYIAGLNTMPSAQELQQQQQTNMDLADENLAFLHNADFFDFDHFGPGVNAFEQQNELKEAGQYAFGNEYQAYPPHLTSPSTMAPSPQSGLPASYPADLHFPGSPNTGDKRKASVAVQSPTDLEEASRQAAEEDKRRRNTAASARFRVKKKQREQALEKQAKDMSDKVQELESKVQQLEMENKWLKELITEKTDSKTIESALEKKTEQNSRDGRSTESRTDGVGTAQPESA